MKFDFFYKCYNFICTSIIRILKILLLNYCLNTIRTRNNIFTTTITTTITTTVTTAVTTAVTTTATSITTIIVATIPLLLKWLVK